MPWIIPSHQAPALLLKRWRPAWFSGLGLVLGSLAPDLEFIVPIRKGTIISHTLLGQVVFTVPVAVLLCFVTCGLVWPWLRRSAASSPHRLPALRNPVGWEWLRLSASALVGGLTHIALDGFTHPGSQTGWAVNLLPALALSVPLGFGWRVPLYEILEHVLSVPLGLAALMMWQASVREAGRRMPQRWDQGRTVAHNPIRPWIVAGGALGAAGAMILRHGPLADLVEYAAYGALDGVAVVLLAGASSGALRRLLGRRAMRRRRSPSAAMA